MVSVDATNSLKNLESFRVLITLDQPFWTLRNEKKEEKRWDLGDAETQGQPFPVSRGHCEKREDDISYKK